MLYTSNIYSQFNNQIVVDADPAIPPPSPKSELKTLDCCTAPVHLVKTFSVSEIMENMEYNKQLIVRFSKMYNT